MIWVEKVKRFVIHRLVDTVVFGPGPEQGSGRGGVGCEGEQKGIPQGRRLYTTSLTHFYLYVCTFKWESALHHYTDTGGVCVCRPRAPEAVVSS